MKTLAELQQGIEDILSTKWKKRDDVCSDSDEQWLDGCGGKTTS